MRILAEQLFDKDIAGAGVTWYTGAEYNDVLGAADALVFQVLVANVSGTFPTLTVGVEHSSDNQHWVSIMPVSQTGVPEIDALPISDNQSLMIYKDGFENGVLLAYIRLAVSLGGSDPACRLKLFACGRTL